MEEISWNEVGCACRVCVGLSVKSTQMPYDGVLAISVGNIILRFVESPCLESFRSSTEVATFGP
jgi:hypothetical protein